MMRNRLVAAWKAILPAALWLAADPAQARSVLYILIDGMNPEYVTEADARGIHVPNLRRFLVEGSYAQGVRGITPTISAPSYATLITGATPSVHGIYHNNYADPADPDNIGRYFAFADEVKAETLWDAADKAGLVTANARWWNTIGAKGIRYNITGYDLWLKGKDQGLRIMRELSRPAGMLPALERDLGPLQGLYDNSVEQDASVARFSIAMIRRYKPQFMTTLFAAIDHEAHDHGPFSAEAVHALERADALVGELRAAFMANDPEANIVVVSDHGQLPYRSTIDLRAAFVEAGLITIETPRPGRAVRVIDWQAEVPFGGGAAPIVLKDPGDTAARARVSAVLRRLAADPANGIGRVFEGQEAKDLGGWTKADFWVTAASGYSFSADYLGPVIEDLGRTQGAHGHILNPGVNAAFFMLGRNVQAGRNLGVVDIRQIAPTVAQALGTKLRDASQTPLPVFRSR